MINNSAVCSMFILTDIMLAVLCIAIHLITCIFDYIVL